MYGMPPVSQPCGHLPCVLPYASEFGCIVDSINDDPQSIASSNGKNGVNNNAINCLSKNDDIISIWNEVFCL